MYTRFGCDELRSSQASTMLPQMFVIPSWIEEDGGRVSRRTHDNSWIFHEKIQVRQGIGPRTSTSPATVSLRPFSQKIKRDGCVTTYRLLRNLAAFVTFSCVNSVSQLRTLSPWQPGTTQRPMTVAMMKDNLDRTLNEHLYMYTFDSRIM